MRYIILTTWLLCAALILVHVYLWSYTRNILQEMTQEMTAHDMKLKKMEEKAAKEAAKEAAVAEEEEHRKARFARTVEQYIHELSEGIPVESSQTSYPDMKKYLIMLGNKIFQQYIQELSERIAQESTVDQQESLTDQQISERYMQESEKLAKESEKLAKVFQLIHVYQNNLPVDMEKRYDWYGYQWYHEYDQPLLEAAKLAMKRVTGTEDYLEIWEKRISEKIDGDISVFHVHPSIAEHVPTYRLSLPAKDISLYQLYSISMVYERQSELLSGMFYRDYHDDNSSSSSSISFGDINPDTYVLCPMAFFQFSLPGAASRRRSKEVHSWEVLAIYSFKNDRARDLLFNLITRPNNDKNPSFAYSTLADEAVYWLTLLPNSRELLPKVKSLLQENITTAFRDEPDLSGRIFDATGKLHDPSMKQLYDILHHQRERSQNEKIPTTSIFFTIERLLWLERGLEFNEKIPVQERERFNFIRRDKVIADSESSKLQEGEEHFTIYFQEYLFPYFYPSGPSFNWVSDFDVDNSYLRMYPKTLENPFWQKRKAFYERELANPRPIYTENQIEYIKARLKDFE